MMYTDMLQLAAVSGLLTLLLSYVLLKVGSKLSARALSLLKPRYLKSTGVRLRKTGAAND